MGSLYEKLQDTAHAKSHAEEHAELRRCYLPSPPPLPPPPFEPPSRPPPAKPPPSSPPSKPPPSKPPPAKPPPSKPPPAKPPPAKPPPAKPPPAKPPPAKPPPAKPPLPSTVTIAVSNGINADNSATRQLVSTSENGGTFDLWTDDGSGRQRWVLEDQTTYYHITVLSGVAPQFGAYLTATADGHLTLSALQPADSGDPALRQRWLLQDLGGGVYNVRVVGGVSGGKSLLSTNEWGTEVNLWTTDDGTGRQRWLLGGV